MTGDRPGLIVIEDLHWVDPTTLELIGLLLERLASSRCLVLCTSRPEFHPPWPGDRLSTFSLEELTADETAAMVQRITGEASVTPAMLTLLVDKTDGNPLFVEEMTRMMLDAGLLDQTGASDQADLLE